MGNVQIDTEIPSVARSYNAFLGDKDNFGVDQDLVARTLRIFPEAREMALANRDWLVRVVSWLAAEAGVTQFLDIGSGLPTRENTHQVAQRWNPDAVVIYVDNDPACAAYGRALLEDNDNTRFLEADLRSPSDILTHPLVTRQLDPTQPIGLIQCSTMHHVSEEENPWGIMAEYIEALPSGSYVALTHFFDPEDDELTPVVRGVERAWREQGLGSGFWRRED